MTTALHFPPYIPATLKEHYFSDVPAPTAGDDNKALTYNHGLAGYVYTSFEAAGAAASVAAAAATALATHAGTASGVHGIGTFGATLNATASQAAAQTALALIPGTNVQAQNANLAAIAGLTTAANKVEYWTGSGAAALADFTAFGRGLVASVNVAATGLLAADGSVTGATGGAQTFTNGAKTGKLAALIDGAVAIDFLKSDGVTSTGISIDTTNSRLNSNRINAIGGLITFSAYGADIFSMHGNVSTVLSGRFQLSSTLVGSTGGISSAQFSPVFSGTLTSPGQFTVYLAQPTKQAGFTNNGIIVGAKFDMSLVSGGTVYAAQFIGGNTGFGTLTPTALVDVAASTTSSASLRIRNGTWPTTPNDGDISNDGTSILAMLNGTNAVNTDGGLSIWMNSSVPTARNVGRLLWRYTDKTDATRKTEGAVTAFDGATEYKPVRWSANGAAMLGVLGAAPALRQVVTGSKASGAALISLLAALATFGWITDSTTA